MITSMLGKLFSRRIAALFLALGMILGVAAPAWAAMPAKTPSDMSMTMPNMIMSGDCMGGVQHDDKNLPSKNSSNSCGICATCGIAISATLLTERSYRSGETAFTHDAARDGIAVPPALPPPIA